MFFFLSKLLDVFLSPYTWALIFVALAVPWTRRSRRSWRRQRAFGGIGLAVLLLASSEPVANGLLYRLEHATASTYRDDVVYDYVILLGGVSDERVVATSGQPAYNDNVERLVMTHRILRDGKARLGIVSGAAMDPSLVEFGEARVLGRQLEDWGIPRERILLEERARNTRENAVFTKEMIDARGGGRVLVVTSAFHMRRSLECFNAVGMSVDVLPVDYRAYEHVRGLAGFLPRGGNLAVTTATMREFLGLYVYRLQGYAKAG